MNDIRNNVVQFPTEKRRQEVDSERFDYIDSLETLCDDIVSDVLSIVYDLGYDIEKPEYSPDISLVLEAVRSFIFRVNEYDHPLQSFAQNMYNTYIENEEFKKKQMELDFGEDE